MFSSMLVVCFFRDLRKYLRLCARLEQVQLKRQNRKEKIAEYIRTHVTCIELCVTSWQSWKSKCKRVSYRKSWVYMAYPCHVIGSKHTVYFARDKINGADVVGSINHVTLLTNRFSKLISLPTSTIFVLRTSESVFYFFEFSCIAAILKI